MRNLIFLIVLILISFSVKSNNAFAQITESSSGVVSKFSCNPNTFPSKLVLEKTSLKSLGIDPRREAVWYTNLNKAHLFSFPESGLSNTGRSVEYDPLTDTSTIRKDEILVAGIPVWDSILTGRPAWNSNSNKLYLFSSARSPKSFNVFEYDPVSGVITKKKAELPEGIKSSSIVCDPNKNKIYFFGGSEPNYIPGLAAPSSTHETYLKQILEYDPQEDKVTIKSETLPVELANSAAVWDIASNKAYIFGGEQGSLVSGEKGLLYADTIIEYDPQTGSVLVKKETFPVYFSRAEAVWDSNSNKAYILGGIRKAKDSTTNVNSNIFEYDPKSEKIMTKISSLPSNPFYTTAVFASAYNRIYTFGEIKTNEYGNTIPGWEVFEINPCRVTPDFTGIWIGNIEEAANEKNKKKATAIRLDLCTKDSLVAGSYNYRGRSSRNQITIDTVISESEVIVKFRDAFGKIENITLKLENEKLRGVFNDGKIFIADRISKINTPSLCPFKQEVIGTKK